MVPPGRTSFKTRSSWGRDALAPLAVSVWMSSGLTPARWRASIWWSGLWSVVETLA